MAHPDDAQQLLTIAQAAERLNVSTSTVRRLLKSGELPHVRCRKRCVRIDPRELTRAVTVNG